MACIQYPKWKSFTLPSREQIHIFRDPPSSIYTRKKERVEWGDVSNWIVEDDSRISEAILNYPRGVNPAVAVEYGSRNAGGSKVHTMNLPNASNPYKVNEAFRPPIFRQEDLLPLSRLKRPYTYGITNPGPGQGFVDCGLDRRMDKQSIQSATNVAKLGSYYPSCIPATATYKKETNQNRNVKNVIDKDPLNVPKSSTSRAEFYDENFSRNLNQDLYSSSNYIKDPNNVINLVTPISDLVDTDQNRDANIRDKDALFSGGLNSSMGVAIHDPNNKDYSGVRVQDRENISAFSVPTDVYRVKNSHNPIFQLEKNLPQYRVNSSVQENYYQPRHIDEKNLEMKSKINPKYSSNPVSGVQSGNDDSAEQRSNVKSKKTTHYTNFADFGGKPYLERELIQNTNQNRR